MTLAAQNCLTFISTSGYLLRLSSLIPMERLQGVDDTPTVESNEAGKSGILARIQKLARSKIAKATLAVTGAVSAAEKADAGLVYPAEFRRPNEINEFPQQIASGFNIVDGAVLRITNGLDATGEDINAIGIFGNNDDYAIDFSFDAGSDVTPLINPNSPPQDGVHHRSIVIQGEQPLAELQEFRLGIDTDPMTGNPDGPAELPDFMRRASVLIGKNGVLTGQAETREQFIELFTGDIFEAEYPPNANINDGYVLTEATGVPEPSSAAYLAVAGGVAGVGAMRRRRKSRE